MNEAEPRWVLRGLGGEAAAVLSVERGCVVLTRDTHLHRSRRSLLLSEVRGVSLERVHYPWMLVTAALVLLKVLWDLAHRPVPGVSADDVFGTARGVHDYARWLAWEVSLVVGAVTAYLVSRRVSLRVFGDAVRPTIPGSRLPNPLRQRSNIQVSVPGGMGDLADAGELLRAIEVMALRERANTRSRARSTMAASVAALGDLPLPGTLDSARSPLRNTRFVGFAVGLASSVVGAIVVAVAAPRAEPDGLVQAPPSVAAEVPTAAIAAPSAPPAVEAPPAAEPTNAVAQAAEAEAPPAEPDDTGGRHGRHRRHSRSRHGRHHRH